MGCLLGAALAAAPVLLLKVRCHLEWLYLDFDTRTKSPDVKSDNLTYGFQPSIGFFKARHSQRPGSGSSDKALETLSVVTCSLIS